MAEETRITFYRVDRCGYYRYGQPTPEFGVMPDILTVLISWTRAKPLGNTCPFQGGDDDDVSPVYCFDIVQDQHNGDVLLTTWNSVPSTEGNIASVDPRSQVGAPSVSLTDLPAGAIPGYATYFWMIPEHNLLATLCFSRRLNGHRGLVKLMNEFMAKCTRYVVVNEEDEGYQVLGYCDSEQ